MKPTLASLGLACALTAGCATLAGPPPAPPVAVPAVGAPNEFTATPVKWRPGLVLTYQVHTSFETIPGDTGHERHTLQWRGVDRTARGTVRVQVRADDLDVGTLLIDEVGNVQDTIAAKPEFAAVMAAFAETMQSPVVRELRAKSFAVGESITWDLPADSFRRLMPRDWGQYLASRFTMRCQFLGYVRLDGVLAAAFRTDVPNMLGSPIRTRDRDNREVRIDSVGAEGVEYFDVVEGYHLAKYEVVTGGGELGGKPFSMRQVELTTLDLVKSSGLQHAGRSLETSPTRTAGHKGDAASERVVYELTSVDLPTAESIRSTSLSVFGVSLGSRDGDMRKALQGIGRPFRERDGSEPSTRDVELFFGEDEAAAYTRKIDSRMIVFRIKDGTIHKIFLYGTPRPPAGGGSPAFRGFDGIAIGHTQTLLRRCEAQDRLRILGREDRITPRSYQQLGLAFTLYEYDQQGIRLAHSLSGEKSGDVSLAGGRTQNCVLEFRQPTGGR